MNANQSYSEELKILSQDEVGKSFIDAYTKRICQTKVDEIFIESCKKGEMDKVKDLFRFTKSPQNGFEWACYGGHLEVAQYLLENNFNLENVNEIKIIIAGGFASACNGNKTEILEYLIFDKKIEKTEDIESYLKLRPNEQAQKMFIVRDLNQKLEDKPSSDKNNQKKLKL